MIDVTRAEKDVLDTIEMPDGRRRNAAGMATRRRLLLAGLRLIERGHYRFSPQDIVKPSGMHKRSFHEHFNNLDSYCEALMEEHGASIRAAIDRDVREYDVPVMRL